MAGFAGEGKEGFFARIEMQGCGFGCLVVVGLPWGGDKGGNPSILDTSSVTAVVRRASPMTKSPSMSESRSEGWHMKLNIGPSVVVSSVTLPLVLSLSLSLSPYLPSSPLSQLLEPAPPSPHRPSLTLEQILFYACISPSNS